MNMLTKLFVFNLLMLTCLQQLAAQQDAREAVMQEIRKISERYKSIPYLSFDMNYYYSKETAPGEYLDSLKGSFKMHQKDYWYSMDSTEVVSGSGYVVLLFKEDNIMYLSRPDSASSSNNPIAVMDSILLNNKDIISHFSEEKNKIIIALDFAQRGNSKRVEYHVNKKTGFLEMVRSVVKSDQLYDPSVRDVLEKSSEYVCVDVFYSNYSKVAFSNNLFDVSRYFRRDGDEYVPVMPFDSYKIFLGNSNL